MRRISIRDKLFTECIGEDEVLVDDDEYNMVVVNAAGISRAYYCLLYTSPSPRD